MEGADDHSGLRVAGLVFEASHTKVDYLDGSVGQHHHVGGLDVAMDDALLVRIAQAETELPNHFELLNERELPSGFKKSLQRISGETFHYDRSEERRVGKECRSRWSP